MSSYKKGLTALTILSILYGVVPVFVRYLLVYLSPIQIVYNNLIVALILQVVIYRKKITLENLKNFAKTDYLLIFIRSVLYFFFGAITYAYALTTAKIGIVILLQITPFMAFLAVVFFKDKLTTLKTGALFLSTIGLLLISAQFSLKEIAFGFGEFLAAVSGLAFSLALITRRLHSKEADDDLLSLGLVFFGLPVVFISSFFFGEPVNFFSESIIAFILVFSLGLVTAVTVFLANYGYSKINGIIANVIASFEPLTAIILGLFLFGETYTSKEIIGGVLIIIASFLVLLEDG